MAIQSEAALEDGLIATLRQMDYEYVQIAEEGNLQDNFKRQLEIHNLKRLAEYGRTEFTDEEFERYSSTLKGVHVLRRQRNSETFIRLTQRTANEYG